MLLLAGFSGTDPMNSNASSNGRAAKQSAPPVSSPDQLPRLGYPDYTTAMSMPAITDRSDRGVPAIACVVAATGLLWSLLDPAASELSTVLLALGVLSGALSLLHLRKALKK